ncbi:hypothetical protein IOD06_08835 [Psychrobacter sp. N25K4-3-2]|uniref:hypothetical protein n=1 Tax=Psychrobacter sp. N25K4-3-2 TaxID=2785026 RepID=UPI00188CCC0E|nr:hypothetical protein [Psychrobacter sp. N25K4-3-2]MBF4489992.1 hypothetical protein [Psychrobacter sp. N25K4-3-2]
MNVRYSSLLLVSILALSGCGGGSDSDSGDSSVTPNTGSPSVEQNTNTQQRQEPEPFAGSYSGVINSDLKDIYNTYLSMSTIVNNDGEFWMVYTNNGFIYNANDLVFGLINGKFKKSSNPNFTSLSSNATDYSFTSNSVGTRSIDLDLGRQNGADFTFFETVVYEDVSNPEGFEEELRYPVFLDYNQGNSTDKLEDYKGVYQGALVTTSTRSTASMVTNAISKGRMGYSIVDEQGCIIEGDITFDPKSIYLRVDGNVDNSAITCHLEEGKVHGLVTKDDDKSKVLMLVNDDNKEAYVFSVVS